MGTEMQYRSASRFYKSRFVGFVCLYLVAAAALFLLSDFLITPDASALVTDWQYICADRLVGLDDSHNRWQKTNVQQKPEMESGDMYILLQRTFSDAERGWLHIESEHSSMLVTINENTVYDTLSGNDAFQASALTRIDLTDAGEKNVEIILYCPHAFSFFAVLVESPAVDHAFGGYLAFCLVAGILFLLLGVVAVMAWVIIKKLRLPIRSSLFFIAAAFFCCAAALFLERMSAMQDSPLPVSIYSLLRMLTALAVFFAPLGVAVDIFGWNGKLEVVSALNILYAAAILFWPYKIFFEALIQIGVIFQLSLLLAMLMLSRKSVMAQRPYAMLSAIAFFVPILFCALDTRFRLLTHAWIFPYLAVALTGGMQLAVSLRQAERAGKHTSVRRSPPVVSAEKTNENQKDVGLLQVLPQKLDVRIRQLISEKCNPPDQHMLHVAAYSRVIAAHMGLESDKADEIAEAALLHDIGKLMVPSDLLSKTGNLTEAEFDEIRRHHLYGERILSGTDSSFFDLAATIAREHHEHVDGSGYLGYVDAEISLPAKIVAVADVFDALTSDRSYKKIWRFDEAFHYITERAGSYYDPEVVKAFVQAKNKLYELYFEYHAGAVPEVTTDNQGGMRK